MTPERHKVFVITLLTSNPGRPTIRAFDDVSDAVHHSNESAQKLIEKLGGMDADALERPAKMWLGEHMVYEAPAVQLMMAFLFDMIHHRGQLSTYLRPMGGKVPAIYGPSADDDGS